MDLVTCRNLLIYLDAETQNKLFPLFNFALNPGGYLFLGKSEGPCGQDDLFAGVSEQTRLFRRLDPARPIVLASPMLPKKKRALPSAVPAAAKPTAATFADMIRMVILDHFAAAVVLIDRKGEIIQFHGQTGKYLNMPVAEPSLNLLVLAKEGFSARLRSSLRKAVQDNGTVLLDNVPVTREEDSPFVRITIAPTLPRGETGPFLAVIFEDISRPQGIGTTGPAADLPQSSEHETVVKQLEDELKDARLELHENTGELQAANEELRVSNEEVVSTNEELQSTIEELETSKEELQSVNEELSIVNSQLAEKVNSLDAANSDLANFLNATAIATLFLDKDLRIKLFTPAATGVLKLIPSDTGRPINDLSLNLAGYDLQADVRSVAANGRVIEREAHSSDGLHYLVRILPYRPQKGGIEGVVVTFNDVTVLRAAEKRNRRLATVVMDSNDAILLFDSNGVILSWNRGAQQMYGWSEAEALLMTINDLTPPDRSAENIDLIRRLSAGEVVFSFETRRKTKDGREIDIWLTATAIKDETGKKVEVIVTTERDLADRMKVEGEVETFSVNQKLKRKISELLQVNKELEAFIYSISHDLRAPLRSVSEFSRIVMEDYAEKLGEKGKDYLTRVRRGAEKMNQLVDGLLRLSRIARQKLERAEVDMSKAALAVVSGLREAGAGRSVEVDIKEGLIAFADPVLTGIVLENLIGNAWKFTSKTERARIEFGELKDHSGEKSVYYIKDNGAGFNPEYMERMFMPFHRLHSEQEYVGTGIGLALVERIIHRHGGRIWAEGKPDQGATIFFTLP
jgi:two-component system CheB/CheR fusion protein